MYIVNNLYSQVCDDEDGGGGGGGGGGGSEFCTILLHFVKYVSNYVGGGEQRSLRDICR